MQMPKLRFKEFTNEWEEKKLSDICSINPSNKTLPFKFMYIDLESVVSGRLINKNIINIDSAPSRAKRLLQQDDILFQTVRPYQMNNYFFNDIYNISVVASTGYAQIRTKYNSKFIYYLLHTKDFQSNVDLRCTGSNYPAINSTELSNIFVHFPKVEEQNKIADFLSLVDKKIELQQKLLNNLNLYKKGLLQKVFSNNSKWKTVKFSSIIKKGKSGGTPTSSNKKYYDGNISFLSITDITSQGKYIYTTKKNISKLGLNNSSAWIVPPNSLIYSIYASVGIPAINKISLATSQAMFNIILKENENLEYVYYYLLYFHDNGLSKLIETGTQGNINAQYVLNLNIPYPSIKEQSRIANLFTTLDNKINFETNKLENLKTYKKGLLQKMFI